MNLCSWVSRSQEKVTKLLNWMADVLTALSGGPTLGPTTLHVRHGASHSPTSPMLLGSTPRLRLGRDESRTLHTLCSSLASSKLGNTLDGRQKRSGQFVATSSRVPLLLVFGNGATGTSYPRWVAGDDCSRDTRVGAVLFLRCFHPIPAANSEHLSLY